MASFEELALSSERELTRIFAVAAPPPFDQLAGSMWRGYNVDPATGLLGIRKFIKAFFSAEHGEEGCNMRVFQGALDAPWVPRTRQGKMEGYAFYLVSAQDAARRCAANPNALLIDYAASPRNPPYHIERLLRDYLVQPDPAVPDVLLGRAYLGIAQLRTPSSFFVLERIGPFTWPL